MSLSADCAFSDNVLASLAHFAEVRFGLHFPRDHWRDLERPVCAASKECRCEPCSYATRLLSSSASPGEIEALVSNLTVGETYFFRETRGLRVLEEQVVPQAGNRHLRIWSAGCATGEEPYSIAMLLRRIIPDLSRWNISILGTDINTRSLGKAHEGIYSEWSFRGVPAWIRTACFSQCTDGRWAIDPGIRRMVRFSYGNLVSDDAIHGLSLIDIVFCCNVWMYLSPQAAKAAADRLQRCLRPGGWLIVSPVEVSHTLFRDFEPVVFPDGTAYRRRGAQPAVMPVSIEPAQLNAIADNTEEGTADSPRPARDRTPAMVRLARACANRGKLTEAFRWCEIAIATGASGASVHYLRASILEEQGALEEAARSLRRALYLEPRFAMGHFTLGNLAARRGRLKESAKHFENTMVLLNAYQPGDILPESGGLTAGRLRELILRWNNA